MPTPIPFADDGGTPAWHAAPRFPVLAVLARSERATVPAEVRGSGVLAWPGCASRTLWDHRALSLR